MNDFSQSISASLQVIRFPSNGWPYVDPDDLALPVLPLPSQLSLECPFSVCLYPISKLLYWPSGYKFWVVLMVSLLPSTARILPACCSAARILLILFGVLGNVLAWPQLDRPANSEGTAVNYRCSRIQCPMNDTNMRADQKRQYNEAIKIEGTKFMYYMYSCFRTALPCLLLYIETIQSTSLPAVIVKGQEEFRPTTACYLNNLNERMDLWAPDTESRVRAADSLMKVRLPLQKDKDFLEDKLISAHKETLFPMSIASMQTLLLVSTLLTVCRALGGFSYGKGYQWD